MIHRASAAWAVVGLRVCGSLGADREGGEYTDDDVGDRRTWRIVGFDCDVRVTEYEGINWIRSSTSNIKVQTTS
jgi:hypothetical protein